jgi:hypothetical protein
MNFMRHMTHIEEIEKEEERKQKNDFRRIVKKVYEETSILCLIVRRHPTPCYENEKQCWYGVLCDFCLEEYHPLGENWTGTDPNGKYRWLLAHPGSVKDALVHLNGKEHRMRVITRLRRAGENLDAYTYRTDELFEFEAQMKKENAKAPSVSARIPSFPLHILLPVPPQIHSFNIT